MNIDLSVFAQYGLLGIILAWFMFRFEKKLDSHTSSIDDLTKAMMLEVLSRDNLSDHLKAEANNILSRVSSRKMELQKP